MWSPVAERVCWNAVQKVPTVFHFLVHPSECMGEEVVGGVRGCMARCHEMVCCESVMIARVIGTTISFR